MRPYIKKRKEKCFGELEVAKAVVDQQQPMCDTRIDNSGKESIEYPKEKTSKSMSKQKRDHKTAGKLAVIERLSNKNKEARPALRRQRQISVKSASLVNTVSSRPTRATTFCISGCGYTCPESQ